MIYIANVQIFSFINVIDCKIIDFWYLKFITLSLNRPTYLQI